MDMFRYSTMKSASTCSNMQQSSDEKSQQITQHEKNSFKMSDDAFLLRRGYFLRDRLLGEGTYSKVKQAYAKIRACDVAVKIVNRKIAPKDFLKKFLPRELEVIGQLKHPNICSFYEILDIGEKVFIVMEHAPNGDLLEYIQKNRFLKEYKAREMFLQLTNALGYLHQHHILHRDLKCENILLTRDFRPLLTDFGFAKHVENFKDYNKTYCGSSAYAPIEILKGVPYEGRAAEVWSLGCILYIISTGAMPFDDSNKAEQIRQMRKGPNFTRTKQMVSEKLQSLILEMLCTDPNKRMQLPEIVSHEWCKIDNNQIQQ